MNYKLLKTENQVSDFAERASRSRELGLDSETTDLDERKGELRLIQISLPNKEVGIVDVRDFRESQKLFPLKRLFESPSVIKILHNAKFDLRWLKHHLDCEVERVFDTLLASQLLSCGNKDDRHNLGAVCERFLGTEVDKHQQTSDWSQKELSENQLEYAAKDARLLHDLRAEQVKRLKQEDLVKTAQLEFDAVLPVAMMEYHGFHLDEGRWREQLENSKAKRIIAADTLQDMLAPGVIQTGLFGRFEINLDSQPVVLEALKRMGIPLTSTDKNEMETYAAEFPVIKHLLEYRAHSKDASAFGENILAFISPESGRIHSSFRQIGAPTGRFSCSKPNIQQIPHDEEYRRCFTPAPGNKLVIADFSQVELRILADVTQDRAFIEGFLSGKDFHTNTAALVFGKTFETVLPEERSFAKRVNFGIAYGIGPGRLSAMCGISFAEAEALLKKYFHTFRKLDFWLKANGKRVVNMGFSRSLSGRKSVYKFDSEDFGQRAQVMRWGNNHVIQGTSADITKRALRLLFDAFKGTTAKIVNIVHDEILVECVSSDAECVKEKLETAMRAAGAEYVKSVPVTADACIADEWKK